VGAGGHGGGEGCNSLTVEYEPVTPTVLLLVDRSSSMFDLPYGTSPTRWQPLYDALMDPVDGPVKQLEGVVRFGFAAYTSNAMSCPGLTELAPALDNYDEIDAVYAPLSTPPAFKAETPTGAALTDAAAALAGIDGPKYIVLVTDGEPDTCAHVDPQCGQDESIYAAQQLYAQGITTIVVGISTDVSGAHLGDLANAGSGQPVLEPAANSNFIYVCVNGGYAQITADYSTAGGNAVYYQPDDQAQLQTQLSTALQGVRECEFELKQGVTVSEAARCDVTIDGAALTHPTDWTMDTETQLTLSEQACATLQTADQITIECPCDVLIK
jgi:hypothetical protein